MPVSYKLQDQLLIIETKGKIKYSDLNTTFNQAFSSPKIRPGLKILVHSLDSMFVPSPGEIRNASEFLEEKMKKFSARLALVVSSSVNYGMGRMLEIYCETKEINLKVFRDVELAKEWLESA